ncbi:MAG TPA: capsule assembly Wzi family protein [Steroidobacteraceae bacterium]|nr:capsule assembly Wzi family protein [Steroidobacteraceae bacterium]
MYFCPAAHRAAHSITEFTKIVASRIKTIYFALPAAFLALAANAALADGVSAYLPLNLEPEIERQIERVLILADEPILKRPFAVGLVELALPQACKRDKVLCAKVKRYLERYSRDYAVAHASATGSITHSPNDPHGAAEAVVPNQHGLPRNSDWEASAQAFVQPSDYFLASAGAIAYSGRTVATGSMLSAGFNWAQIDVGYRDHWFSPAVDSPMMIGTEAPTMPSITLSNYEPLTRFGFQYELFLAQMSRSDHILGGGQGTRIQRSGNPKLFGAQFSIEPFSGWSFGVNRQLQYGGGGLPDSASTLFRNFFRPGGVSQTQGNQEASYVTRFIYPGKIPFALYAQYAGENNLNGGSYLLGEAALTVGIDFPRLWRYFDLSYETSEWQNAWYVNNPFLDGMTNDKLVLGSWGGDQRLFNDGVGARSQMLRIGWEPPFGGYLEERVRTLVNQIYGAYPYHHYLDFTMRYSRPWKELTVGGEAVAGRDVFGQSFSRLSAFVRYGGDSHTRDYESGEDEETPDADEPHTEVFVDGGGSANKVRTDLDKNLPIITSKVTFSPHVAAGVRRTVSDHNDWGVRVELDRVDGHLLTGVRPIDYRHRYGEHLELSLFAGVARYDLATPAYGLYGGIGPAWRDIVPKWDISVDFRYAQNIARNHVLPTDIHGIRPDSFYKVQSVIGYVSRRF